VAASLMDKETVMTSTDQVNVLLVDDQPAKLLSYEAILADLQVNLLKASSGRQALSIC
jgi:response regulator RpfG family c-di-GMP phosphodiesterase